MDPSGECAHAKAAARIAAKAARKAAFEAGGSKAADALAEAFFASGPGASLTGGTVVAGYMPIGSEIDPRPLMRACAKRGLTLCLPVIPDEPGPLLFRRWSPGDPLEPNGFGTVAPACAAETVVPSLVLVPLLAFDRTGARLGYGQGHYDRTLADLVQRGALETMGLAFAVQEIARVPSEPHDIALHWILTDAGAIRCTGEGQ